MAKLRLLAIDLGAESGRAVVGSWGHGQFTLEEVHRFPNRPVRLFGHLHWNWLELHREIVTGVRKAASGGPLTSIGIDTWAVDFGLLGPDDTLLGAPFHYRDCLTDGVMERVLTEVGADFIFDETGIQFLPFNTLYQLIALSQHRPQQLAAARSLLMMGELFTYLLTGEKVSEFTNATTTQLFNPQAGTWSEALFRRFRLPREIMPQIVQPGTVVGRLLSSVAEETGAGPVPVVVPAVHDTGSAVAAVPGTGDDWCYLSSGTWSLLGVEGTQPLITPRAQQYNLTNEGGVAGTYRLLKNVMGLWIVQECRRHWEQQGTSYSYDELTRLAASAPPLRTLIDPDDRRFLAPGAMPQKIADFALETGQPVPETVGQYVRCVLESLALKYRMVIEQLDEVTGRSLRVVHVVGGGSQNQLLNRFTAEATGRHVLAGPVEATAMGNLAVQAIAHGELGSIKEARSLIRSSVALEEYAPEHRAMWDEAYGRFTEMVAEAAAS